jgi:hypothetical protein
MAGAALSTGFFWMMGWDFERGAVGAFWAIFTLIAGLAMAVIVNLKPNDL